MSSEFQLFSSLRYDTALLGVPDSTFRHASWNYVNRSPLYMLDFHRDRMLRAAKHWGWGAAIAALDGQEGLDRLARFILQNIQDDVQTRPLRVRVTISQDGHLGFMSSPVPETPLQNLYPRELPPPGVLPGQGDEERFPSRNPEYEVVVTDLRISRSEYTHFKTTKREMYDRARQQARIGISDNKEVLIVNGDDGSIMEGSTTTPYVWRDGRWVTPAVSKAFDPESGSGGQDGTSRRWALERYRYDIPFPIQAKLRQELGLQKVKAIRNKNYRPHGTKSYVYLLNRFGFETTKPGPYYNKPVGDLPTKQCTNKCARGYSGLVKKTADGQPGQVTAEDQQNDSMYLCEVSIGTPAQKMMLDFDTGSADLWAPSSGHNAFDPKKSSTFKSAKQMTWKITYGDGSSASGDVGTDVVSIGGLSIKDQAVELAKTMSQQFSEGSGDGLLGLAFPKINTIMSNGQADPQPTPVTNMISQSDIPKEAELFTSCFYSSRDEGKESFYTFGWIDQDLVKASGQEIAWTDIDNSEGFWMFPSESATIAGRKITLSGNKAIADTGTTLALVSDEVCDALYKQIKGATYSDKDQGYLIPKSISADDLPEFSIAVGGTEFTIQKEDLLFAEADEQNWYGGVQSRGQNPFDILGDTFLKSIYAMWDQGHNRFGAVPKIEKTQNMNPPPESGPQSGEGSSGGQY
ncbi:aspartic peptidase domain-containing protein [Echria macrotheca]|uniref:Aspartic peptidase domain-containing protein n=1 Tax=Echria macrotheca TaxID=438768 RepID=A0AAJ0BR94_9PEZI|nr:aspartic peptidase domain-containing protein [Echria macrotheca]